METKDHSTRPHVILSCALLWGEVSGLFALVRIMDWKNDKEFSQGTTGHVERVEDAT